MRETRHSGLVLAALMASLIAGCSSDEYTVSTRQGYLSLTAEVHGEFAMSDGSVYTLPTSQIPEGEDFAVTLRQGEAYGHSWPLLSQMPSNESYQSGEYEVTLEHEAMDGGPGFSGTTSFAIPSGGRATVNVACRPSTSMAEVKFGERESGGYELRGLTIHASGGDYASASEDKTLFITAGRQRYYAELADANGKTVNAAIAYENETERAQGERCHASLAGNALTLEVDGEKTTLAVNAELFAGTAPEITAVGFSEGSVLNVKEGLTLSEPVEMTVESDRALTALRLSVLSPILNTVNAPSEIDLLHMSAEEADFMELAGLECTVSPDKKSAEVNFTRVLETMASYTNSTSKFILMAEDEAGICSEPMTLTVDTRTIFFEIKDIKAATVGIDEARVRLVATENDIERADFAIYKIGADETNESRCEITEWNELNDGSVEVAFRVPEGLEPVEVAVEYMGLPRVKATIERTNPEFKIMTDPFATTAIAYIAAEDSAVASAVTRLASFFVNGQRASVWKRDAGLHVAVINGLTPGTTYKLSAVLVPDCGSTTVNMTTERAESIPMGDFSDWGVLYDVKGLPSGGRYSTTNVSVVNRQNYADIYVKWPKKAWSSINAKTFYQGSTNANTWYMQPSSEIVPGPVEGDMKAICITSVGWDHQGEQIPDYVQKEGESLMYSNNIPTVGHRSAGRLFIGEYSYSESGGEVYKTGLSFTSRPSSLNGYFRYLPDLNDNSDQGYVEVELINRSGTEEEVIAHGYQEFSTSPDYKTFTVPLVYAILGKKATHLRVMFSSSVKGGAPGDDESEVPVTAYPEQGYCHGSSLWIYNLSFSY